MLLILGLTCLIALIVTPPIIFIKMTATYNVLQGCLAILGFISWVLFSPVLILIGIRIGLAG